jgi:hypothetical protein
LEIVELVGERFEASMELLFEGHPIIYNGIVIQLESRKEMNVKIYSEWQKNITKVIAIEEIEKGKAIIHNLSKTKNKLADLLNSAKLRYELLYDIGSAGIVICEEYDGNTKWRSDINE